MKADTLVGGIVIGVILALFFLFIVVISVLHTISRRKRGESLENIPRTPVYSSAVPTQAASSDLISMDTSKVENRSNISGEAS